MATGETRRREVILVGTGARARAWLEPLRRSARLQPVAVVARTAPTKLNLPYFPSLASAMAAFPEAAFAVALPPHAGLETALALAEAGRETIVEAPLDLALATTELPDGAARVRVAHGWTTLPGAAVLGALLARLARARLQLTIAGLPESEVGDTVECLVHALALVRKLVPEARCESAEQLPGGGLRILLRASNATGEYEVDLTIRLRGRGLEARVESALGGVAWSVQGDRETLRRDGTSTIESRDIVPAEVRALAQLLPGGTRGDDLVTTRDVMRLACACLDRLPSMLPPGQRVFQQSAAIAERYPGDVPRRFGLLGELPEASAVREVEILRPPTLREPFELWAFRAGLKPVTFLTVLRSEVEATRAMFGDVHCEERLRRVRVESQDRWVDRRDEGEERVELYLAKEPALARRAAELQTDVDPTAALRELGALVGYPPCCVEAFARQDDRSNNSRNRYYTYARSCRPDGTPAGPCHWELNNLHTVLVPFYPCTFYCEAALAWARASFAELEVAHPIEAGQISEILRMPVLYFDHEHQIVLDGTADAHRATYGSVRILNSASRGWRRIAGSLARGNQLVLEDPRVLRAWRHERLMCDLRWSDPRMAFLLPVGIASGA